MPSRKPSLIPVPQYRNLTIPRRLGRARADVADEIARMAADGWSFVEVSDRRSETTTLRFERREQWTVDELLDDVEARTDDAPLVRFVSG